MFAEWLAASGTVCLRSGSVLDVCGKVWGWSSKPLPGILVNVDWTL